MTHGQPPPGYRYGPHPGPYQPPKKKRPILPWVIIALSVTIILAGVGTITFFLGASSSRDEPSAASDTPSASSDEPSAVTVAPTRTSAPTENETQPRTLKAATAAAQEWVDRRAAGDFAGVWLLWNKQVRNGISQFGYVVLSETCTSSMTKLPSTATGVRLDGPEKAIIRLEVLGGFQVPATMVYEDGEWFMAPDSEFLNELGMPLSQIIASRDAAGTCNE